jgi:hypothetical protein
MFDNALVGLTLLKVIARCDKDRRIVGQVSHQLPVVNGVRPKAVWAVCIMHMEVVVGIMRVKRM